MQTRTSSHRRDLVIRTLAVTTASLLGILWVALGVQDVDILWGSRRRRLRREGRGGERAEAEVNLDALDPKLEKQLEQMLGNYGVELALCDHRRAVGWRPRRRRVVSASLSKVRRWRLRATRAPRCSRSSPAQAPERRLRCVRRLPRRATRVNAKLLIRGGEGRANWGMLALGQRGDRTLGQEPREPGRPGRCGSPHGLRRRAPRRTHSVSRPLICPWTTTPVRSRLLASVTTESARITPPR